MIGNKDTHSRTLLKGINKLTHMQAISIVLRNSTSMLVMEPPFLETEMERMKQMLRKEGGQREVLAWSQGYDSQSFGKRLTGKFLLLLGIDIISTEREKMIGFTYNLEQLQVCWRFPVYSLEFAWFLLSFIYIP